MASHEFTPVIDNQGKNQAYCNQIFRYDLAIEWGFYLEGIQILYALFEDKLSSLLFYAGIFDDTREYITNNPQVRGFLLDILGINERRQIKLWRISDKLEYFKTILEFSRSRDSIENSENYADVLSRQVCRSRNAFEIPAVLDDISTWTTTRNSLVHDLLTINPDGMQEKLKAANDEGYILYRKLDKYYKAFKRGNSIRKHFNIN